MWSIGRRTGVWPSGSRRTGGPIAGPSSHGFAGKIRPPLQSSLRPRHRRHSTRRRYRPARRPPCWARTRAPNHHISADSGSLAEGNSGSVAFGFTVYRTGSTDVASSVDWQVSGAGSSPADGADFASALSGTVSFASGEYSKGFTVSAAGDTAHEPDEGFAVTLSNASPGDIGTSSAGATIVNDDAGPPVNNPPVAQGNVKLIYLGPPGQATIFNVTANDSDPDGHTVRLVSVTQGTKGVAAVASTTSVSYTPTYSVAL
ncbi:Ig-like domain-containing protein [Phenylobacterium terrae]|uniref:Ig-like domain-containing protein n=1 Tax=Phenylobacterium terrae TaxID=2665495 RepID=A0ABW4N9W2_9CAUL